MLSALCFRNAAPLIALFSGSVASAQELPRFSLPVACEVGRSCFIQNYVDADPSSSAKDYQCGSRSYDGHNGTDFRLPTMAAQRAGVDVLAAADGQVLRLRDGVEDISVREPGRAAAVKGTECGNAIIIEHPDGWQTQYCHMARGSLRVKAGDHVKAGQTIGKIGLSGLTEYAHLHFTVRHRGQVADPFAYSSPPGSCGEGQSLWQSSLRPSLAYKPRAILNSGFAAAAVPMAALEAGDVQQQQPDLASPALVAYVRGIGLKQGDVQSLILKDPSGQTLVDNRAKPLERDQAQTLLYAGARKPAAGWEQGLYQATYAVIHGGKIVLERSFDIHLQPAQ
ncbi:M23 family metallopeptidase [Bosea sp. CRIB-10]|uniref:M23 family metallopeptidase n=1 Tax=Bosea sp. CRIB-10 TaxID=378404 RepID=UPI000B896E4B|nr:M23 family metallopeptidase [Bosea sp. CRIB-10]